MNNEYVKSDIYTTIDLEMSQPEQNIIQIGACIGNVVTGEILATGRYYVKVEESLSEYIVKLTNITDHDLETKGSTLIEAFYQLKKLHLEHNSNKELVQWGQGDESKLKADLLSKSLDINEWCFNRRTFDVKAIYQTYCIANGIKRQSGLSKSMTKLGLQFKGSKHDGCDDAINTFLMFHELINKMRY